jgi:DNA-3-methyladenine glycosylase II
MYEPSSEINRIVQVFEKDRVMLDLFHRFGIPQSGIQADIFNALIRSIVGQQLSVKAAQTIYSRFRKLIEGEPDPEKLINTPVESLRSVGLSAQKSNYVHQVARFFLENDLIKTRWDQLSDDEIIQLLTQIKGVGIWTVQMLLIFPMDRPDVFPADDLGIQNGIKKMYQLQSEGKMLRQEIVEISQKWRPYRSIASKLIWMGRDTI